MPDGSVRVVVKGYKKEVMEFWERLQKQLLGKAENPTFSQPAEMAEMPIETDRFFHKLQCEQMEKFVDVGLCLKGSIDSMSAKIGGMDGKIDGMANKIDGMSGKIDGMSSTIDHMSGKIDNMSSKIDGMGNKIDGMSGNIDHMSSKLDTLPGDIAKELAKLKKNGLL
jgi:peptidoglycan hydrolase CwlO-like protein/acylphosphatase